MAPSSRLVSVLLVFGLIYMTGAFAQDLDGANDLTVEEADIHRELTGKNPCKNADDGEHCIYKDGYDEKEGKCCGGKCKDHCPPPKPVNPCKYASEGDHCTYKDGYDEKEGTCCGGKCKDYCPPPKPVNPCKYASEGDHCTYKDGYDEKEGTCCGGKCKSYCPPPKPVNPCKGKHAEGIDCQYLDNHKLKDGKCCGGKCKSYCPPPVPLCGYKPCKKTCCDSKCVDTNTDKKNCGECYHDCEKELKCKAKCVYGQCQKA